MAYETVAPAFRIYGVTATVTPPVGVPFTATVIPHTGGEWRGAVRGDEVVDIRPRYDFRRDQVPALAIGTTFLAPELKGGPARRWVIDAIEDLDPEVFHAVVRAG